ncbi:MAG: NAD(P)-binding domain-containing protein [Acidobacteriota bacterium]|nr:NAD(P)-binding domain-containing protein [Acidobacteriota bacterium]
MSQAPREIAILGAGPMGRAVAAAASRAGQRIFFGSSRPSAARDAATRAGSQAHGGSREEALAAADFIVVALRWQGLEEALRESAGHWKGKVAVDLSNPATPDGRTLLLGHSTSGAEEVARLIPGARVVKALNHLYAEVLEAGDPFSSGAPAAFYCGDDAASKLRVAAWLDSLGLAPVDAGPLSSARLLEPLAQLAVELVERQGRPAADTAFALARR